MSQDLLARLFDHPRFRGMALSPDQRHLAYVCNEAGRYDLYLHEIDTGRRRQVTSLENRDAGTLAFIRGGLAFTTDVAGREHWQISLLRGKERPQPLTTASTAQHIIHPRAASPDGRFLAYSSNEDRRERMDVHLIDLEGAAAPVVVSTGGYLLPGTWSTNGRFLLVAEISAIDSIALHAFDIADQRLVRITPAGEESGYRPGPWFPDGKSFLVATDAGRDFGALARMTLDGRMTILHETCGEVAGLAMDQVGNRVAIAVEEEGAQRLRILDLAGSRQVDLEDLDSGTLCDRWSDELFVRDDGSVLFYLSASRHPKQPMLLKPGRGIAEPLVSATPRGVDAQEVRAPRSVRFSADDGLSLQGLLYRPDRQGPRPCLLFLHGGPLAAAKPDWDPFAQYLLSRGIGFFAPNVRGSSGFGRRFGRLSSRDWGGGDLADAIAAGRYLRSLPWVDPARCAVGGISYGGFLALSCLVREPQWWAAGIDIFGPADLEALVRDSPPSLRGLIAASAGDPDRDREHLRSRSPIHFADRITAPLLVVQGANDPRVPLAQANALVAKLREHGVPVEFLLLAAEGHGMGELASWMTVFGAAARHLEEHLVRG